MEKVFQWLELKLQKKKGLYRAESRGKPFQGLIAACAYDMLNKDLTAPI